MSFGEKLKMYRENKNLTQEELAHLIGVAKSTISGYEKNSREPDVIKIKKLAAALNVSADDLLEIESKEKTILTKDDIQLIKKYRSLDSHGKEIIDNVLALELKRYEDFLRDVSKEINSYKHETGIIQLPYFDLPVSAGSGVFLDSDTYEILDVPDTTASRQATYAVRVSGNSMEPDFQNGDKILVRQQPTLEVGDLGIFILNGEGYFKEYGGDCLISLNKAYEPIKISSDDSIYIKGKVIGKL